MMVSVVPVAKAPDLCDDILSDEARVKPHLIGVLNAFRPTTFPYVIPKLCVFALLIGGHGEVRCRVRIVNAQNRDVVHESPKQPIVFTDRLQTQYLMLRLTGITLHGPGDYWVELTCNGQFMDDAVLRILG